MHWRLKSLPMLGAVVLLSAAEVSANGMRCENKLVRPGDSAYQVKSLCGPPDDVQQRTEQRRIARAVERPCATNPSGRCAYVIEDIVQVVIDEWTYDFGPQRFMQYLTFEAGKLLTVKSGGYGHKQP
jgi:Protein of unknown function (DUF2845)